MKRTLLAAAITGALAATFPFASLGNDEGRAEVAKCYSSCSSVAREAAATMRFEWEGVYTGASGARLLLSCVEFQDHARYLDLCKATCLDLEEAYGTRKSHARSRFLRLYNNFQTPLQRAGLWTNFKSSPSYAGGSMSSFSAACRRFAKARRNEVQLFTQEEMFGDEPFMVNGQPAEELFSEELREALRVE